MNKILFKQVNASTLSYIRILLGGLGIYIFNDWQPYFVESLVHSKYFLYYDGFHWVKMMPEYYLNICFSLFTVSAFMVFIGCYYRLFSIIMFLGYAYLFLLDRGHYNNHYYLYLMLFFFLTIVDGNKMYSVDRWLKKETSVMVSNWQVLLFKGQLMIVYFFGGIAKLNLDWFMGFPLRFWLYDNSYDFAEWFGIFLRTKFAALFYSYAGLVFDLSMGFLLFYKRTRRFALLPVIFFHISNHFFWNIGSFPWVMILTLPIFFDPNTIQEFLKTIRNTNFRKIVKSIENFSFKKFIKFFTNPLKSKKLITNKPIIRFPTINRKRLVYSFFIVWFAFQLLFPLRRFVYPGYASWTGQGHLFAWRMMLLDTVDAFRIKIEIPDEDVAFFVDVEQYVNDRQFRKIRREPTQLIQFTKFLKNELKEKGDIENPVIYLEVWKSVNERTATLLNDTTLNYAEVKNDPFKGAYWINDWKPTDELPTFSQTKYENWKHFLDAN